jgi:hypothetical protein
MPLFPPAMFVPDAIHLIVNNPDSKCIEFVEVFHFIHSGVGFLYNATG